MSSRVRGLAAEFGLGPDDISGLWPTRRGGRFGEHRSVLVDGALSSTSMERVDSPDWVAAAALIGDPTRAVMLSELLGGWALTATELAACARVAPSTASDHLAKLASGGLVTLETQGRHRYYRLAGPSIARLLEALGAHSPAPRRRHADARGDLRFARSCYDHLAGVLGVALWSALIERHVLVEDGAEHRVTAGGEAWFASMGIDVASVRTSRRAFARRCLDWTERRPHVAGALGAAMLSRFIDLGWLARRPRQRVLDLTPAGEQGFARELNVELAGAESSRLD